MGRGEAAVDLEQVRSRVGTPRAGPQEGEGEPKWGRRRGRGRWHATARGQAFPVGRHRCLLPQPPGSCGRASVPAVGG